MILGAFADRHVTGLGPEAIDDFERLLNAPDQDVYAWITEAAPPPPEHDTALLAAIRAFRLTLSDAPAS